IIFMFIDDMGYADPSCFGNPHVKTPRIDQLAEEGLKLTNFYVNSPICSPSRVSVTTGQYPSRWKIHSFLESRKNNDERQMADFLPAEAPPRRANYKPPVMPRRTSGNGISGAVETWMTRRCLRLMVSMNQR
ncbi:MAG: sulfatase-like hydrolase/transferase, partial [Verrucomicrobiota bacterium]